MNPDSLKESFTSVLGSKINVRSAGKGRPLLVLHRDTGRTWTEFHDLLARNYRVIAPSLPGFDESERPLWMRSAPQMALMLGFLMEKLEIERCAAIGLGFGAWIAAEMAVACPQRFESMV